MLVREYVFLSKLCAGVVEKWRVKVNRDSYGAYSWFSQNSVIGTQVADSSRNSMIGDSSSKVSVSKH